MTSMEKPKLYYDYATERLFYSILGGEDVVTIQALLEAGADINFRDSKGYTPLLYACLKERKDRVKIVELLIKSGANVNVKCNQNWTVLRFAAIQGWTEIIRTLVKLVPDLDVRDNYGETALHHASRSGHLEIIQCLVDERADIDIKSFEDFTPLLCAAQVLGEKAVNLLLNLGANVDVCKEKLLHYAVRNGWADLVRSLVKTVPNVNECVFGETFLHAASNIGHLEIVKCLLEQGADVNIINDGGLWRGEAPLHRASGYGDLELVKCFVANGANVNVKNANGATPVMLAAEFCHKNVVDILLYCGANVDVIEKKQTLLNHAIMNRWLDVVQFITKQNYDLDTRAHDGVTALCYACASLQFNIAQCLLQAGATWDIEDDFGNSPLYYATKGLGCKLIKLLIENGAYLKTVDYEVIVQSSLLTVLLQDEEFCYQAIINKFHHDLTELYKLPASRGLPCIKKMGISSDSKAAREIRQTVIFEIQTKGRCNILEVRPIVLSMFAVTSVLNYCEKNNSEL